MCEACAAVKMIVCTKLHALQCMQYPTTDQQEHVPQRLLLPQEH